MWTDSYLIHGLTARVNQSNQVTLMGVTSESNTFSVFLVIVDPTLNNICLTSELLYHPACSNVRMTLQDFNVRCMSLTWFLVTAINMFYQIILDNIKQHTLKESITCIRGYNYLNTRKQMMCFVATTWFYSMTSFWLLNYLESNGNTGCQWLSWLEHHSSLNNVILEIHGYWLVTK